MSIKSNDDVGRLKVLAEEAIAEARKLGSSSAEVQINEAVGQSVTVRCGETETVSHSNDNGFGITAYTGFSRGHASSSDLTWGSIKKTVEAAVTIARLTAEDSFSGLADRNLLATENLDLDLYHPSALSVEQCRDLALSCESAAYDADARITNSEGASFSSGESRFVYANSHGFVDGYASTQHSLSCGVIAGTGDDMQRDHWWSVARSFDDLESAMQVGDRAGSRAAKRLGSKKIDTQKAMVLFEAPVAASLIGNYVGAVSGGNLYRKQSFLLGSLGTKIFPDFMQISDVAHEKRGLASSSFDADGVATQNRQVIKNGIVEGYFLSAYSGRKLGMKTTGNAGGNHNLRVDPTASDLSDLLKGMDRGLLVTELLGHGTNMVTGDYSRGAAGFWVEKGEIIFPVEEITIAGNLKEMFKSISGVGDDKCVRGSIQTGSILIDGMTLAGN